MRGYFEIGVYHPKSEVNIGTLWRSAYQLGACGIFTVGRRYKEQASDTTNSWKHIPLRNYLSLENFIEQLPLQAKLIGVEFGGRDLDCFAHPEQAIYLLGAEDHGLPSTILDNCYSVIEIPSVRQLSYNVAVAGSIVMYHRLMSKSRLSLPEVTA